MIVNPAIIVYGLIFLAVLLLVEGIYLVVFGKSISLNSRVNRRLDLLEKGGQREKVLADAILSGLARRSFLKGVARTTGCSQRPDSQRELE